ncbi:hypothetical protein AALP_AAs72696U000100 [Arabis alpina]|uniref:Exocyst complex component Sec3 PIP2-binding N-terminal domain-containing protein n=1 Tax=Arabis alpina TaxID=50452 RepID=A0A087G274_ARAAL|nr:hypothetical protein AALP_AAs72696U000100 [Arabis alpina]
MAKSSAEDGELRRACQAAIEGTKQQIVMSIRVAKSRGVWGKSGKLSGQMAKPRVLALSVKSNGQQKEAFLRPTKMYKLKYISKVEVITNDPSGCTFTLGFDSLRSQSVAPSQWTMRNTDDSYLMGIGEAEAFSESLKHEIQALEAANIYAIMESEPLVDEVLNGLEAVTNIVDDMEEWLGIFNLKLRYMREDIESIEIGNNKLEKQSVNNNALIKELDKFIEKLRVPSEYAASLTGGSFDEADMLKNIEACEWLAKALKGLEVPNLDPIYANMRAVREKRRELEKLKATFVRRASEFLRNYFPSLVDFMMSNKSRYFSQRGQLKKPDHADLQYKCKTYARLLQHLKGFDKNCLVPLRKSYCSSMNLLLRREAREFANELRASTKVSRNPTVWLEGTTGSSHNANTDTSAVSDAYDKMLTIYIPLLIDESSFFAQLMCFEVPTLVPPGDEACNQIEKNDRNVRQIGVLPFIPRFAVLATRMEHYIHGRSRSLVDQAYTKFVSIMFMTLKKMAQKDPKYTDIILLENYAAFQTSLFDLANVVAILAEFYEQARKAYEQACTRHVNMIIYYFDKKIRDVMHTITPEEIPFQLGLSKAELRKMLQSSLSGMEKSMAAMYKKLQKSLSSEESLRALWDKCKKEFLDKYESLVQLVANVYPNEKVLPVTELRRLLASM